MALVQVMSSGTAQLVIPKVIKLYKAQILLVGGPRGSVGAYVRVLCRTYLNVVRTNELKLAGGSQRDPTVVLQG
jgi:hypothetical protein